MIWAVSGHGILSVAFPDLTKIQGDETLVVISIIDTFVNQRIPIWEHLYNKQLVF